jgi:hypothetical protein
MKKAIASILALLIFALPTYACHLLGVHEVDVKIMAKSIDAGVFDSSSD